ncbi:hypothetical protein JW899_04645 [Candidatus Uhrbacteria bacterium]|nr:hypothetical protein [Candidatus Uhrbacteria bacterium]
MESRSIRVVLVILGIVTVGLSVLSTALFFRLRQVESDLAAVSGQAARPLEADIAVQFVPVEEKAEQDPDSTVIGGVEPVFPSFSVVVGEKMPHNLSRVDFSPTIGDIYRIHYDRPWNVLLMAVVEPSGLRSVWRLDRDLKLTRVLVENGRSGEIFLGSDSLGRVYAGFADPGTLYRTEDLGQTWKRVAEGIDGAFWAIADDGHGTLWGSLHAYNRAILYRSVDDGFTWEEWKDFQEVFPEYAKTYRSGDDRFELRHLHAVAYWKGRLFVGVGDVARFTVVSDDGGETWTRVWDEGFTASSVLADGSGLLLGPDRLQSHGVALYDPVANRTTEVWNPIPHGYAGYTYSIILMDGVYYAAFHTEANEVSEFSGHSGIIVSPDGRKWYPFLTFEKLTSTARTDMFLATGEQWVHGYLSLNGALYRFEPPFGRWFEMHEPFGR